MPDYIRVDFCDGNLNGVVRIEFDRYRQNNADICQLVWLTKNTSYENVGGIFLRKNTIDS